MGNLCVYYDRHFDDQLYPCWFIARLEKIDWNKSTAYVPLDAPFKRYYAEDFDYEALYVSVELADLTVSPNRQKSFGLDIQRIKQRIEKLGGKPADISHFVIQMCDIEEVMQINRMLYFEWE